MDRNHKIICNICIDPVAHVAAGFFLFPSPPLDFHDLMIIISFMSIAENLKY